MKRGDGGILRLSEVGPRPADATPVAQSVVAVVVEPVVVTLLTPLAPLEAASVAAPVVQTGLLLGGSGCPAPLLTLRGPVPPIGAGGKGNWASTAMLPSVPSMVV